MDIQMAQWRDGLISNAEILGMLLNKQDTLYAHMEEVRQVMRAAEIRAADERMKRLGI